MHPHRNLAIDRAIARDRNFTLEEIEQSKTLKAVGEDFIREYDGKDSFMYKLKSFRTLSNKQLRVALEIMVREGRLTREPNKDPIFEGYFTVNFKESEYTLRITQYTGERYKVPEGTQSVSLLTGPNNTRDYTPVAFIYPNRKLAMGSRHKENGPLTNAIRVLLGCDDPIVYGEAFAFKSERCWRCLRPLTKTKSIIRGVGPHCAKILGIVDPDMSKYGAYNQDVIARKAKKERPKKNCEMCLGDGEIPDDDLAGELGLSGIYVPCPECMPNSYDTKVDQLMANRPKPRVEGEELFSE